MTEVISSSVAEKALCWCEGRKLRSSFAVTPISLLPAVDCGGKLHETAILHASSASSVGASSTESSIAQLKTASHISNKNPPPWRGAAGLISPSVFLLLRRDNAFRLIRWDAAVVGNDREQVGLHLVPLLNQKSLGFKYTANRRAVPSRQDRKSVV